MDGSRLLLTTDHAASQVRDGEIVDVENVSKYVTPELAYIVRIERAKAKVGGQEAVTPISLRVTMIMRPEDGVWKIVHRHADPITSARPAESVDECLGLRLMVGAGVEDARPGNEDEEPRSPCGKKWLAIGSDGSSFRASTP